MVTIIFSALFSGTVFGILSLLTFFIAYQSPKGRVGKVEFDSLPGVMTPNTLKSREAWMVAHEKTSSSFCLLAVYFSITGVVLMVLSFYELSLNLQYLFGGFLLFGIVWFGALCVIGDRAASRFNSEQVNKRGNGSNI